MNHIKNIMINLLLFTCQTILYAEIKVPLMEEEETSQPVAERQSPSVAEIQEMINRSFARKEQAKETSKSIEYAYVYNTTRQEIQIGSPVIFSFNGLITDSIKVKYKVDSSDIVVEKAGIYSIVFMIRCTTNDKSFALYLNDTIIPGTTYGFSEKDTYNAGAAGVGFGTSQHRNATAASFQFGAGASQPRPSEYGINVGQAIISVKRNDILTLKNVSQDGKPAILKTNNYNSNIQYKPINASMIITQLN